MKEYIGEEIVGVYVRAIRVRQPKMGMRKLYCLLKAVITENGITMGRDKFHAYLRANDLLVKPRRRRIQTTNSRHGYRKYPNIIKGYEASGPEQIWVSDITFVTTETGFVYVSLITDQYSKKIMGYQAHPTLEAEGSLEALKMALKNRSHRETRLIHHSDRGIQYACEKYVTLLKRNDIQISMSASGNPYENAVAERVNGTVKTEFSLDGCFRDIDQVKKVLRESVSIYNKERPHASCDYLTPEQAHQRQGRLKKRWRQYKRNVPPKKVDEDTQKAVDQLLLKSI